MNFELSVNRFSIEYQYSVCWGNHIFKGEDPALERFLRESCSTLKPVPVLVFLDQGFAAAWPAVAGDIVRWCQAHADLVSLRGAPELLPGGESCKEGLKVPQKVMAAAQKADTRNLWALTVSFPDLVQEAKDRYNAPGGMLEGD